MSTRLTRSLLALALLAALPASLRAQAADSLAFPRQVLKWFNTSQADSLFAHSGEQMKARMQSAANVTGMMAQLAEQVGEQKALEGEYQFDKDGQKVYIAVARFSKQADPGAFVVQYAPGSTVFDRFGVMPLARAKELFPEAKLP
ncbi:MAG TPA: hypothetical protein VEA99_01635 [Gemmatimonadaceae bacterium]|nr:hypothetical protein [Gemmatimonadaceae bacterium]